MQAKTLTKFIDYKIVSPKKITSDVAENIARHVYFVFNVYDEAVVREPNIKMIESWVIEGLAVDFYDYIDAKAKTDRKKFHHIYEFGEIGQPNSRLFKVISARNTTGSGGFEKGTRASVRFLNAKKPTPESSSFSGKQYVFKNKALVFERGTPIKIKPNNSRNLLVFPENKKGTGEDRKWVFTEKPVIIQNPGGKRTTGALANTFRYYARVWSAQYLKEDLKWLNSLIKEAARRGAPKKASSSATRAAAQKAGKSAVVKATSKRKGSR
jgi:hypothetical protein